MVDGVCNIGRQPRAMCGDVTMLHPPDATDFVIENDRLFDVGLPHLPPLTPFRSLSTVIVFHIDLLENDE